MKRTELSKYSRGLDPAPQPPPPTCRLTPRRTAAFSDKRSVSTVYTTRIFLDGTAN